MAVSLIGLAVAACSGGKAMVKDPRTGKVGTEEQLAKEDPGSVFGEGGLGATLFGDDAPKKIEGGSGIGVNSFLWRATLDTVSFLPITTADPFGGVVITDWYSLAESPSERFKLNAFILGRALRADGVRVAVFRQVLDQGGAWRDAAVPEGAGAKVEDAILMRARQFRGETMGR